MPKYANRKSSVAPSFGEIPTHWKEIKTKFLFRFGRGLSISRENMSDEGVPCIHYGDIHGSYGFSINPAESSIGRVDESYLSTSPQAVVEYGDFLFVGSSEDVEGSGNFTYVNANISAIAGSDTITLRPISPINCRFMAYLFDSIAYREQIRTKVYGVTVFHPTQAMIKNATAVLPSGLEQGAIVTYLDRRTDEIDSLLADLQSQAEILDQYKRELIAETVTKGLDKSVTMKDSGVDWIGEVPSKWHIVKNKRLFKKVKNIVGSDEGKYPVLSLSLKGVIEKDREDNTGKIPAKYDNYYQIVEKGNLLFCLFDMDVTPCVVGLIEHDGIVSPAYSHFAPLHAKEISIRFYYYWFLQMHQQGLFISLSNNIRNSINADDFGRIPVLFPPIEEQERIANHIDNQTAGIKSLIVDINMQIDKLKKYRQIVINDAVTGKIKTIKEG